MNEISTKVVKLDINFILDNFYKPNLWGKTWTIFEWDGYKITFTIHTINTEFGSLYYRLKLHKDGATLARSSYNPISYQKEHRNIKVIQKGISGAAIRLIGDYEKDLIRITNAYQEAEALEHKIELEAEAKAEALLDELEITNEEIREAYIESQKQKHETSEYTSNVLDVYQYKKCLKLYYSYALFSGETDRIDKFKNIAKLNGFKVGALRKEIKEKLDLIQTGDFSDTLEMDEI